MVTEAKAMSDAELYQVQCDLIGACERIGALEDMRVKDGAIVMDLHAQNDKLMRN